MYHKLDNAALRLGSRVRLRLKTAGSPSVMRFIERCVIPYIYGYSIFLKAGKMPFGELDHGELCSLQDLATLLGMEVGPAIPYCVLATMTRRRANKRPCPCGSGRRLGRCHNRKVNMLRDRVGRLVLVKEMQTIAAAFREASSRKSATPPRAQPVEAQSLHDADPLPGIYCSKPRQNGGLSRDRWLDSNGVTASDVEHSGRYPIASSRFVGSATL